MHSEKKLGSVECAGWDGAEKQLKTWDCRAHLHCTKEVTKMCHHDMQTFPGIAQTLRRRPKKLIIPCGTFPALLGPLWHHCYY